MPSSLRFLTQRWFQVLGGGILLFAGAEQGLKYTGNLNLIPTVILVGAFVIPISFVSYFLSAERTVDRQLHSELSLPLLTVTFFVGGAIGVIAAGIIEYSTLTTMNPGTILGVAVIEEAAKLMIPVVIFLFSSKYRSQADGLLFGVATGMGFAALETMGYSMVAFIRSQGDVTVLQEVLLMRGLLSPVGHAAWTGFVCSVLWGSRQRSGRSFAAPVLVAFLVAVLLHTLWDASGASGNVAVTYLGYAAVGVVSMALILHQLIITRRLSGPPVRAEQ